MDLYDGPDTVRDESGSPDKNLPYAGPDVGGSAIDADAVIPLHSGQLGHSQVGLDSLEDDGASVESEAHPGRRLQRLHQIPAFGAGSLLVSAGGSRRPCQRQSSGRSSPRSSSEPIAMSNAYCERLRIAVPVLEHVAGKRLVTGRRPTMSGLFVVALLE